MSKYRLQPIDVSGLRTVSIHDRDAKVTTNHFARPYRRGEGVLGLLDAMPRLLAADSLRGIVAAMIAARQKKKQIVWGLGGHVIKCGLAPVLIRLMDMGYATAFAMNGATTIHDFEIAIAGKTSEDVEEVLPDGRFGSAQETGAGMSGAIAGGVRDGIGIGEALGRRLEKVAHRDHEESSLLLAAYKQGVPVTVHVAIGTDTPHTHPSCDGSALGWASHRDFRLLCSVVAGMHEGGVYLNVGSAVVLPEVFLKAVSTVRNLRHPLADFTTVNFDFLQHYRPKLNVVERPHAKSGGRGYSITGHHEIMIPLLAAILADCEG